MNEHDYSQIINRIVCDTLLIEKLDNHEKLFESGLMNTIGLANIILAIEKAFDIEIPVVTINIENFQSVNAISRLISRIAGKEQMQPMDS